MEIQHKIEVLAVFIYVAYSLKNIDVLLGAMEMAALTIEAEFPIWHNEIKVVLFIVGFCLIPLIDFYIWVRYRN